MMRHLTIRLWGVWLMLVLATLFSAWTAADGLPGGAGMPAAALAVAVGFAKVWLIGMHFMALRDAPPWLRSLFNAWSLVVGGGVTLLILS